MLPDSLLVLIFIFAVPILVILGMFTTHRLRLFRQKAPQERVRLQRRFLRTFALLLVLLALGKFVLDLAYIRGGDPIASNQASAASTLRTINTALVSYAATYERGFPDTLTKLGPPSSGQPDADHAGLFDWVFLGGSDGRTPTIFTKYGYKFLYQPGVAVEGRIAAYTITADPLQGEPKGQRFFYTDESAVIRANTIRPATISDSPI